MTTKNQSQWITSQPFVLTNQIVQRTELAYLICDSTKQWAIWVAKKLLKSDPNGQTTWLLNQSFNYEIYPYDNQGQLGQKVACNADKIVEIFIHPLINDQSSH